MIKATDSNGDVKRGAYDPWPEFYPPSDEDTDVFEMSNVPAWNVRWDAIEEQQTRRKRGLIIAIDVDFDVKP